MRDFYTYWCYPTFYMLIISYMAYTGFMGYLCAYIPDREGKREGNTDNRKEEHQQKGKGTEERSIKINSA